jgi:hypothetical protein
VDELNIRFRPIAVRGGAEGGQPVIEIKHKQTGEALLRVDPAELFDTASLEEAFRAGKKMEELTLEDGIEGAQLKGMNLNPEACLPRRGKPRLSNRGGRGPY